MTEGTVLLVTLMAGAIFVLLAIPLLAEIIGILLPAHRPALTRTQSTTIPGNNAHEKKRS